MPGARFRGGCTLIIDLATAEVRYMVRKKVDSAWRFANQMKFAADTSNGLQWQLFADRPTPANPSLDASRARIEKFVGAHGKEESGREIGAEAAAANARGSCRKQLEQ